MFKAFGRWASKEHLVHLQFNQKINATVEMWHCQVKFMAAAGLRQSPI
jgi:hypothetical protein